MNHKVISHKESFEIIFSKLRARKPFWFVRFGDGDHVLMYKQSLGKIVGGGNRFYVTEKLQKEIIECYNIVDENFLIGTMLNDQTPRQMARHERQIRKDLLPDNLVKRDKLLAMSCLFEIFLVYPDKFKKFVEELRKTSTLFVGCYHHKNLDKIYGGGEYVKLGVQNCYGNIDQWYPELLKKAEKVDKIILSAGQSSRVIAKRLYKEGVKKMVLDVGSLSDAFIFNTPIRKIIHGRIFMKRVETKVNRNTRFLLQ